MKNSVAKFFTLLPTLIAVVFFATSGILGTMYVRADKERARQQVMQERNWQLILRMNDYQVNHNASSQSALVAKEEYVEKLWAAIMKPSTDYQLDLEAMLWLHQAEGAVLSVPTNPLKPMSWMPSATLKSPSGKRTMVIFQRGDYPYWENQKLGQGFFVIENGRPMNPAWFIHMPEIGRESNDFIEKPHWVSENEIAYTEYIDAMCGSEDAYGVSTCIHRTPKTFKLQ